MQAKFSATESSGFDGAGKYFLSICKATYRELLRQPMRNKDSTWSIVSKVDQHVSWSIERNSDDKDCVGCHIPHTQRDFIYAAQGLKRLGTLCFP